MITPKVWGSTEALVETPFIQIHRATIRSGMTCSWHHHEAKVNGFYLLEGVLDVQTDVDGQVATHQMQPGDFVAIEAGVIHRFRTVSPGPGALCLEVYWSPGLSQDIVRRSLGGPTNGQVSN